MKGSTRLFSLFDPKIYPITNGARLQQHDSGLLWWLDHPEASTLSAAVLELSAAVLELPAAVSALPAAVLAWYVVASALPKAAFELSVAVSALPGVALVWSAAVSALPVADLALSQLPKNRLLLLL